MNPENTNNPHGGDVNAIAAALGITDVPNVRFDFSVNINPLGPPNCIRNILTGSLAEVTHYPDIWADTAISALASAHNVPSNTIIIGNGSTELFGNIIQALKPKKPAWPVPCYAGYSEVCNAYGIKGTSISYTDASHNFSINLSKIDVGNADMIFLASPNNPTGTLLDPDEIISFARKHPKTWIILDESFMDFVPDSERYTLIKTDIPENIIIVKSLTKFFAIPGLRLGMAYAHPDTMKQIKRTRLPWSVNTLAQKAAMAVYQDKDYIARTRSNVKALRETLIDGLEKLDGYTVYHSAANFVIIKLPKSLTASELQKRLLPHGILIRSCENFEGLGKAYCRLAVRPEKEIQHLLSTIANLSNHTHCVNSVENSPSQASPQVRSDPMDREDSPNGSEEGFPPEADAPVAHRSQVSDLSPSPFPLQVSGLRSQVSTSPLMVVGTMSNSGKSIIASAFCRYFKQKGLTVAPFKAQNMALNSFVTQEGGEMGRAQVVQAQAAGIKPHTDMNPVLLKPTGEAGSQVIVNGKPIGNFPARDYYKMKNEMRTAAHDAYDRLAAQYDIIVLEGAGSPTEINLMEEDFVNMAMAEYANANVVLVADIDRGGVFASIYGTVSLLPEKYRRLIKGIIINKFRGDESLLTPGIEEIEALTGIPVLGVIPFVRDLRIEDEDSLGLDGRRHTQNAILDIAVVRLPRISNYTDFFALENTNGVAVRFLSHPDELKTTDLLVIPGSKNTRADLQFLHETGWSNIITKLAESGVPIFGICGGYQMLGNRVADPKGVEGDAGEDIGLNLLPLCTILEERKELAQVEGMTTPSLPFAMPNTSFSGYEIHAGRTAASVAISSPLTITQRLTAQTREQAGAVSDDGLVFGCYIHGLFDNVDLKNQLLDWLCKRKNITPPTWHNTTLMDAEFDRLSELLKKKLDLTPLNIG